MNDLKSIQHLTEKLCMNETIDGLHFWGPKLYLSTDHSQYDEVFLSIEGTFMIIENDETTIIKRSDNAKLQQLCTLAFQKISSVKLFAPNNLCIQFESGLCLEIIGENEQFEGWQLEARVDEDLTLIVAGPGSDLTLFD